MCLPPKVPPLRDSLPNDSYFFDKKIHRSVLDDLADTLARDKEQP